ncbi:hypothetical protein ACYFX5_16545 [Bremerella sp. T1]|uniref:hypothetical protein n=1 Tax=Bremerella sp. TYQ1 TaxID=3119568 RepID=UPI001CCA5211|nr:hypothetical protein [Bremerella volcania]UBM34668.1 hypothetical protein LA756_18495 [Bremerella volcania]
MEKLHVELIEHPHYLEYVCSGEHVFDDWVELLQQIRADATRKEETRILINVLGLLQPIDNMMRYRLGLLVGEKIGASLKVAALNPADEVNHFWETVAHNRGSNVQAGSDRDALVTWLLEPT